MRLYLRGPRGIYLLPSVLKFIGLSSLTLLGTIWIQEVKNSVWVMQRRSRNKETTLSSASINEPSYHRSNNISWVPFHNRTRGGGSNDLPRILFWTTVYGVWFSRLPDHQRGDQAYYRQCEDRCYITNDRRLLHSSDAVVFYGRDLDIDDLPARRARAQKWVYWSLEPPPHCYHNSLAYLNDTFNWTMSYRYDSDIVEAYGRLTRRNTLLDHSAQSLEKVWKMKTKMAVWAVTNCQTTGKREDYVEELQKHIGVDVYGLCGTHNCDRDHLYTCHQMFERKYFFWLAFENSLCKDYITEKFYGTLSFNLIPVVFGSANYSAVAPPGSYIDALSFKSPKLLAEQLQTVAKDFRIYQSYFGWRKLYNLTAWKYYNFCTLCKKLYSDDFLRTTVYGSILEWWKTTSHCQVWNRFTNELDDWQWGVRKYA